VASRICGPVTALSLQARSGNADERSQSDGPGASHVRNLFDAANASMIIVQPPKRRGALIAGAVTSFDAALCLADIPTAVKRPREGAHRARTKICRLPTTLTTMPSRRPQVNRLTSSLSQRSGAGAPIDSQGA
jgi:hypothetical protein